MFKYKSNRTSPEQFGGSEYATKRRPERTEIRSYRSNGQIPEDEDADPVLAALLSIGKKIKIPKNIIIINQEESANHAFLIRSGCIKIFSLLPDGRCQIYGFIFPGDILGVSLNAKYLYRAVSLTPVILQKIDKDKLEILCNENCDVARHILCGVNNELVAAQDQIMLLGRKTATERIASFILMVGRNMGANINRGDPIHFPMSRVDIADYLGLTPETVSRVFSSMKKNGILRQVSNNNISCFRSDSLAAIANDNRDLVAASLD